MTKDITSQARQGMFWTIFFHLFQLIFRFGSSIILARILFPEDFGLMGLASIAIQLARRLANFGFSMVLVQRKENQPEHYDTIFILEVALMSIVTGLLFASASYWAILFDNVRLEAIIKVISFDFLLKGLATVPQAILRRNMQFKELGIVQTVERAISLSTTLAFAFSGFGVWSLVLGTLAGNLGNRLTLFYYARWFPGFRFRFQALKDCFAFGAWVYITTYINYGINKVDYFVIGKVLGATQLGFYERAFDLMSLPRQQIVTKINTVIFATFSRIQDDDEKLIKGLLRITRYLSLIAYPLMIWLFFAAPSFVHIIYGAKWLPVIRPLQIMCFTGIIDSLTLLFSPLLQAKGMIGNEARRRFLYFILLCGVVLAGISNGINGVAWGISLASLVHLGLMLHLTIRHLPLTIGKFLAAQKSAITYGGIQILVLLLFQYAAPYYHIDPHSLLMLGSISLLSPAAYLGAHWFIGFEDVQDIFAEFMNELKKFLTRLGLPAFWVNGIPKK